MRLLDVVVVSLLIVVRLACSSCCDSCDSRLYQGMVGSFAVDDDDAAHRDR